MSENPAPDARTTLRRFAGLAFIAAIFTYALIVFGGVVRITGSGMGCGDDWPLCNGQLIPPMDFETLIEYGHRLAALFVSALVFAVAGYAFLHRRAAEFVRRKLFVLSVIAVALLIVQVMVGAVTVWLELPTSTVVLHLALASALLALLIVAGLRGLVPQSLRPEGSSPGYQRWAHFSAGLGFVLLVLGALVANTGAAPLCQGFPLCNGQLLPEGGGLVHLHWTHRLLAYAMVVIVITATVMAVRYDAPVAVSRAAVVATGLTIGQIAVGAEMVLLDLASALRALHLAMGIALWAALVVWATLARRLPQAE